jgi:hypothetical protein
LYAFGNAQTVRREIMHQAYGTCSSNYPSGNVIAL